jgi:hypothetical protein
MHARCSTVLCCTDDVSFQWERPILRDPPTENPLSDQSYVDAIRGSIPAEATDFAWCRDGRHNKLLMVDPMLEP